jgi:catechol 2,3-dioxygenase-like lactoylglutathione lyase family enzyme
MTVRGLRRIIVSVAELDRALAFYRDALGFDEKYQVGDVVMLVVPGSGDQELLLHRRPPTPGLAGVAVSLLVDDVDAMTAAAVRAGGNMVDAPADQPWGERQSVLLDPDGHVLCLVSGANG